MANDRRASVCVSPSFFAEMLAEPSFLIYILTEPPPRRDRSLTPAATTVVGRREAMRMSFLNNNHAPGRLP
jgi:hypothetical protein